MVHYQLFSIIPAEDKPFSIVLEELLVQQTKEGYRLHSLVMYPPDFRTKDERGIIILEHETVDAIQLS